MFCFLSNDQLSFKWEISTPPSLFFLNGQHPPPSFLLGVGNIFFLVDGREGQQTQAFPRAAKATATLLSVTFGVKNKSPILKQEVFIYHYWKDTPGTCL